MERFSTISYGPCIAPNADKIMVRRLDYGAAIRGYDHFLALTTDSARFVGVIESGQIALAPDGQKINIKEANPLLSIPAEEVGPDFIVEYRMSDEEEWSGAGDENGTIAVGTASCVGTGTYWSQVIGIGDGSTVVFNTPHLAAISRIYVGEDAGAFAITGSREVTFTDAPEIGVVVYAKWSNEPCVLVKVGDQIVTEYGYHRINRIIDAWHFELAWYPPAACVGYHRCASAAPSGDNEVPYSLPCSTDTLQFRLVLVPRNREDAATRVGVEGMMLVYTGAGERQRLGG